MGKVDGSCALGVLGCRETAAAPEAVWKLLARVEGCLVKGEDSCGEAGA